VRLLFVDDEPNLLSGLRRLTRPVRDWSIRFADGGQTALDLLAVEPADVVVTDMRMPGMDGLELLRQVREHHPQIACIVLTGYVEAECEAEASPLADGWLSKPCTLESLCDAVESAVQRRRTAASP
jgi:CheY-like chemotaxis protein